MKHIPSLDWLRGFAILSVLCVHQQFHPLMSSGWIGVDLFFVISGFLVSSLLFNEYKTTSKITPVRFLVRRGFKIYPSFYVLIFITIILRSIFGPTFTFRNALNELIFIQNYSSGLWGHTWSLAIEEHFYISLAIGFYMLTTIKSNTSPFQKLPFILCGICLSVFAYRMVDALVLNSHISFYESKKTHARIDALAFGVLLSYLYNFHLSPLKAFVYKLRYFLFFCSLLLIAPNFIYHQGHIVTYTVGYSGLYLGFGIILLLSLFIYLPQWFHLLLTPVRIIGKYSYSIYLWHLFVQSAVMEGIMKRIFPAGIGSVVSFSIYIFLSIVTGWIASNIIEQPALRLRESLYSN